MDGKVHMSHAISVGTEILSLELPVPLTLVFNFNIYI